MTATLIDTHALTDPNQPLVVLTETAADNANGNVIHNAGKTVLVVRNSDNVDHTITFAGQSPGKDGTLISPTTVSKAFVIPAGKSAVIGPFSPSEFGAPTTADGTLTTQGGAGSEAVSQVGFTVTSNTLKVYPLYLDIDIQGDACAGWF